MAMMKWILAGVTALALISAIVIFKFSSHTGLGGGVEVTWELLGELDYVTGQTKDELKNLDNQQVRIPGFMVPLEDSQKKVSEFLLVPSPQACIHVPPPPPNQMVYVKMTEPAEAAFGPIWVYGKFKINAKKHMYGVASFELEATAIEPYH